VAGYATWEMDNPSLSDYGGNNWAPESLCAGICSQAGSDAAQTDAARQRLEQKAVRYRRVESAMALEIRTAIIRFARPNNR